MKTFVFVAAAVAAVTIGVRPASAADVYSGQTINFIIGGNPGGGYDTYARTVARHLADHIPGHPSIVPQNMPGAGSGKAAQYMATVAPKDGTAIAALYPGAIAGPLLDDQTKWHFDPTKFVYVGSADSGQRLCLTWKTSKTKTFDDARKRKTIMGASQAGGSTRDYAYLLNHMAGTRFDVVSGYKGSVDILLAMERGEVEGLCGFDWSSLLAQKPDWVKNKSVNIILQMGVEPNEDLSKRGVPEVWKYVQSDDDRQAIKLIVSQQVFGRPYILPPGTPADRATILRAAFDATVKDKAFLADAEKARITISPTSGDKVQALVKELYATPKRIVDKAKSATTPES
ncbi:MAG: Bug family tripartite tricarboxylate transporter substrate binding protein [Gemmatimonas sp.]